MENGILIWVFRILNWGAILYLFYTIYRIQKKSSKKELDYKIKMIQNNNLKLMLNPHFVFGVLNSIQYYLIKHDLDKTQIDLSKFSNFMRSNFELSQKEFVDLETELIYLEEYILLQKLRFGDTISYEINSHDNEKIKDLRIPSMLIQPVLDDLINNYMALGDGPYSIVLDTKIVDKSINISISINSNEIIDMKSLSQRNMISKALKITENRLSLMIDVYNKDFSMNINHEEDEEDEQSQSKSKSTILMKLPLNIN